MQDRTRYAQHLGSEDPWRVTEVTLVRLLERDDRFYAMVPMPEK